MSYYSRKLQNSWDAFRMRYLSLRGLIILILLILLAVVGVPLIVSFVLRSTYASLIYTSVENLPTQDTAVVFGASVFSDSTSDVVTERVQVAVDLFKQGKVKQLLLSGASDGENYNEPAQMQELAVSLGVPLENIVTDDAGLSTYASCYRARYEFNLSGVVLVTQELHLIRALYVCNSVGLTAIGFVAELTDIDYTEDPLRELAALLKAVWEVNFAKPAFELDSFIVE